MILIILTLVIIGGILLIYRVPVAPKGKLAIVIDDFGYTLNNQPILEQIKYPLTCAILPNLSYSRKLSQDLHLKGFEIILHLPMEPREIDKLEKNTITTLQRETEILQIISQDLNNIIYSKGVSNHMGSRITEDRRIMEVILKELKKRHLYFLDSFVSPKSVALSVAGKINLGFARRDVFLDNTAEPGYIKGQINKLKIIAKRRGQAIGIGHNRKVTLEILKELMPQIEREGYKFVYVSDLVE
jgi:polysaccharide deacetylase 2 family uncharacterized protein YibQ